MEELWERVRAGRHTIVLGDVPAEPAPSVRVVRVRCDVPSATLGPLHEAQRKVEALLGGGAPLFVDARARMMKGLRRRLLGDLPALEMEGALVELLNRLARSSDRPAALWLTAVDAADEATLSMLRRILGRPGWLKLPLVLVFRSAAPAELCEAVGAEGVLRASPHERVSARAPSSWDFRALPTDVLRVLRAGAVVGSGFEAELVAALLRVDVLDVLDLLQRAADAGVPVEDLGEARFHLPEPMLDALRASMLPSLMTTWHQRLAELLGGGFEEQQEAEDYGVETPWRGPAEDAEEQEGVHVAEAPASPMTEAPQAQVVRPIADRKTIAPPTERGAQLSPGPWRYADIFGAAGPARVVVSAAPEVPAAVTKGAWERVSVGVIDAGAMSMRPRVAEAPRTPLPPVSARDEARAASHLAAAGDLDASAERFLAAARQAVEQGATAQASAFAEKAIGILDELPPSPPRTRVRARALLELGKLRWHSTSPSAGGAAEEPESTLGAALETLERARAALGDGAPPELGAEIAAAIAGVCYDLGDTASLSRALEELAFASRLSMAAGDPTGAARLLNDQAAVHVRLGDPVQATHLLTESRKIFETRAAGDPVAAAEMAETDHLFARIPLHVAARPGREGDALTMGLDHAIAAERAYLRLDAKRELGRVWETMGRLELRKGRLDRARDRLNAAIGAQEAIGDLVGLARSTAALSELLAADGRVGEALSVLADSIALNLEKGSPIGLAFNRRGLAALERAAVAAPEAAEALAETRARLEEAEAVLGRMRLPGE